MQSDCVVKSGTLIALISEILFILSVKFIWSYLKLLLPCKLKFWIVRHFYHSRLRHLGTFGIQILEWPLWEHRLIWSSEWIAKESNFNSKSWGSNESVLRKIRRPLICLRLDPEHLIRWASGAKSLGSLQLCRFVIIRLKCFVCINWKIDWSTSVSELQWLNAGIMSQ